MKFILQLETDSGTLSFKQGMTRRFYNPSLLTLDNEIIRDTVERYERQYREQMIYGNPVILGNEVGVTYTSTASTSSDWTIGTVSSVSATADVSDGIHPTPTDAYIAERRRGYERYSEFVQDRMPSTNPRSRR